MNVYPTRVELSVDCRMLAGHDEDEVEAEVRAALAGVEAEWELEWIGVPIRGNASPYPTRLSDAIRTVLQRHVPDAELANSHSWASPTPTGSAPPTPRSWRTTSPRTSSRATTRSRTRFHNVDERIHVRDLAFQALFAERLALELLSERPGRWRAAPPIDLLAAVAAHDRRLRSA